MGWTTLLYQPIGSVAPASNFIISDSDYVEILTEIDIQTPIPEAVRSIRRGKSFLFLGCRFSTQLERSFARQIMKRSSDRHFAVLPEPLTRNEARFLERAEHRPHRDATGELCRKADSGAGSARRSWPPPPRRDAAGRAPDRCALAIRPAVCAGVPRADASGACGLRAS